VDVVVSGEPAQVAVEVAAEIPVVRGGLTQDVDRGGTGAQQAGDSSSSGSCVSTSTWSWWCVWW